MNAERLLEVYEQISEAPDAIARLRRFVLDLAVRGKLVEQDAADEPASELLVRIDEERKRLHALNEIKKPKKLPPFDVVPFGLPSSWVWARIRDVTSDRGQEVPSDCFTYIDVSAIGKEAGVVSDPKVLGPDEAPSRARKITRKGDVIYSCVRPYLLNVAVITEDFEPAPIASTAFAILNGYDLVLPWYLWIALRSPFMVECVERDQRGQAYPAINDKDFSLLPLPLPPLAEQHRIVAKVDELMALCDRLEEARKAREELRDKLTAASLARLTAPDSTPEEFPTHAAFALKALPALTTRPDQIKTLRQTILNLAVRGKLVEQQALEGTGQELMSNIASCLDRRTFARADSSLIDFPIPEGWDLKSLDAITEDGPKNGLSPTKTENPSAPKAITLTATTSGQFDGRHFKRVDVSLTAAEPFWLQPNDLLFQRGNTPEYVGMAAIYDGPEREFLYPDLIMRVRISSAMSLRFVHLWCISPVARGYLIANATGAQKTMPKINQGVLKAGAQRHDPDRQQYHRFPDQPQIRQERHAGREGRPGQ